MILTKLKLQNFKKYKSFSIDFNEGLVGIIGKNGSGKSTIFESILFALYGEFKTRGSKELIRNSNATTKDVVVVALEFEFDSCMYKVEREFRGKSLSANAKFYKNEELTTTGAKEVTSAISSLIKMGKEAFIHTLFASQKELTSLSSLKNEDRKKMIRRLLGLEKIDFVEKELIEKSRELKRSISAFDEILLGESELKEKELQIQSLKSSQELDAKELKEKRAEFEKLILQDTALKQELEEFVKVKELKQKSLNEINILKTTIDSDTQTKIKIEQELVALQEKEKALEKLSHIKKEYTTLQGLLKEQEKLKAESLKKEGLEKEQVQLREQYTKVSKDITILNEECGVYDDLSMQEKTLQNSLSLINTKLLETQKLERELNANISSEEKIIKITQDKIEKIVALGDSSACPTCTRPLLEEYDKVLHSLNATVIEIQKEKIQKYTNEITLLQKDIVEIQKQNSEQQQTLQLVSNKLALVKSKQNDLLKAKEYFKEVSQKGLKNKEELQTLQECLYQASTHKKIEDDLNAIRKHYDEVLSLEAQVKRKELLLKDESVVSKKIEVSKKSLIDKENASKKINYDEKTHASKIAQGKELEKEKDEKQKYIHSITLKIAKLEGEIKTIQNSLDTNALQIKKVQVKKDDLQDYEKIKLSLVEFKTKLNAKVSPRISATASKMYNQITKGKYQHIEVDNEFDFFIYDGGKRYPIERFSGGEVDLANLVLRIAISKTLSELNGVGSIGFLAFDEVFGSQDESRRMEILETFHTLKEQYRQIFLISHEMEIKEMFETIIEL